MSKYSQLEFGLDSNSGPELPCENRNCKRTFKTVSGLGYHLINCQSGKQEATRLLGAAKEAWVQRCKRRKLNTGASVSAAPVEVNEDTLVDLSSGLGGQSIENQFGGESVLGVSSVVEPQFPPNEVAPELVPTGGSSGQNISPGVEVPSDSDLPIAKRKAQRTRQRPERFRDVLPQAVPNIPPDPTDHQSDEANASSTSTTDEAGGVQSAALIPRYFRTSPNIFGLSKKFYGTKLPSHSPEDGLTLGDFLENPTDGRARLTSQPVPHAEANLFSPYPNQSSFELGDWYWNTGAQKSHTNFKDLVGIVSDADFKKEDVRHTNWTAINATLASNPTETSSGSGFEWLDDGWNSSPINIEVPFHGKTKEPGPKPYFVGELHHRSIVSVVRERLESLDVGAQFHFEPYELLWDPGNGSKEVPVYGEMYTSARFRAMHRELLNSPPEPGCDAPRAIVPLMFWSDATQLTSFGQAKLWPLYLYLGNDSKYERCKPSAKLCHHIAYFQKLPDSFNDFTASFDRGGKGPSAAFLAHCNREVFHAQWKILLDEEFINAWKHGILVKCADGIVRRFYLRIITYSADYPEKALIALIRNNGTCPCPRCLVLKNKIPMMGGKRDLAARTSTARQNDPQYREKIKKAWALIYEQNYAVSSVVVDRLTAEMSLVPTRNAFSTRLAAFEFNVFDILVVDLMHEFELGVWKGLFTHLVRLLNAIDSSKVVEMDRRYRQVPIFGHAGVRRFSANSSEMKKMAARDYESLLQCAIPVFDGLFPGPDNQIILNLLFCCAHWHFLAKLRLHTDQTLDELKTCTEILASKFKEFQKKTCSSHKTYELPKEQQKRQQRTAKKVKSTPAVQEAEEEKAQTQNNGRKEASFNIATYKYHALADYAATIRKYGTTDSYSTESGELEHRTSKARYKQTNRKNYIKQMTEVERRQARLTKIRAKTSSNSTPAAVNDEANDDDTNPSPETHHVIGKTENIPVDIGSFVRENREDPAFKDFIPKLKQHLLPRIRHILMADGFTPGDSTKGDWEKVLLKHNRIYAHHTMRINFTTYDVRRAGDVIKTNGPRCNLMVLDPDMSGSDVPKHPFWYARVLGIYHANVTYHGEKNRDCHPRRIEFIWVRWYELTNLGTWKPQRLDQVRLGSVLDDESFGFIDPADILRGCHIVPNFGRGKAVPKGAPGRSSRAQDVHDWQSYYVNRFADRDMAMRYYWGFGVGHTYAHGKRAVVDVNVDSSEEIDEDESDAEAGAVSQESAFTEGTADDLDPGSREPSVAPDSDDAPSDPDSDSEGDEEELESDPEGDEEELESEEETYRSNPN